jgi:arabinan endo-1,5-alpha-L-arabinosidase
MARDRLLLLACVMASACSSPGASGQDPTTTHDAGGTAVASSGSGGGGTTSGTEGATTTGTTVTGTTTTTASCTTRISYGDAWLPPPNHPASYDDVTGPVTWDGTCGFDGRNSFALLSNGFKPYFAGRGACEIAVDTTCSGAAPCATRITYGAAWLPPPNHPASYDDVTGRVFWDRTCVNQGTGSYAQISNGWAPHFTGLGACDLSFRYTGCGGLYQNAVVPQGCADPGVLRDGSQYILACTSGNAADAFSLRTSPDLAHWSAAGSIFPAGHGPTWAASDFWAPEIHRVGAGYVAYFSARHRDGSLSVGAATASSAVGPFTDVGQPLVHDPAMGNIDATELEDTGGTRYLVWKVDGNAVGKPTPIRAQPLSANGTALTGAPVTLITNDLAWEGGVVEGPWIIAHGGSYYLFYSGNAYYNGTYAVGVARASAPLGPYQKLGAPLLVTNAAWIGPGHCSVVDTPAGDTVIVYHAWAPGHVNGPGDVREMLIDEVVWSNGWPSVPEAPSVGSRPMP